jgi:hypothetical protein
MDAIRFFPMIHPSGYPDKTDATDRRIERLNEDYRASLKQKKVQDKIQDIAFEIYTKTHQQNKLRLEIFTNRKLDLLV